jgi:chromosome partitioning protein
MHVVAVLSEKGGAGKTTVTIHIAVAATLAGLDTVIIDLDPQASSADWGDRRGEGVSPEATAIPPVRLKKLLGELRGNGVQMAVIDTGRDSNNAGYTAAQAADLVLIPCKPGGFDVQALNRTLNLCRLAGKRPYVVLNELHPGATRAEADMRESLLAIDGETKGRVYDCEICPVTLYRRTAYRNASITNKTAQETEPQSVAALEIGSLYKWINQQLVLSTKRQFEKETI